MVKPIKVFILLLVLELSSFCNTTYIGEKVCQECHTKAFKEWTNSHHDLAMQVASNNSVLGDFSNISFTSVNNITTLFYKKGSKFMIRTDGENGILQDYEISYTFGVYPLQQYLVKFPNGNIQVLDIAWDSRSKKLGGQRWYHLHPHEKIDSNDVLHWSGPNMNWNYMCADCHSTNLKKNYNIKTHEYKTKWSSINVSCEACHGPASDHVKWAKYSKKDIKILKNYLTEDFNYLKDRQWHFKENKSTAILSLKQNSSEIEVCAKCHSRRIQFDDKFKAGDKFKEHYQALYLNEDLYFEDGKIKGEVYIYNSFLQSKMYEAGVTCSDCHNPHTLQRKSIGDNICFKCHKTNIFNTPKHHKHTQNSKGASCISCHMPSKIYMGVDERNDHSFRLPRPDLSVGTKIPNACNNCHKDKTALWASQSMEKWYGNIRKGKQDFSHALSALHQDSKEASKLLYKLLMSDNPNIAKATAISYLGNYQNKQTLTTTLQMLKNNNIDIKLNALKALENFPLKYTTQATFKALDDTNKVVRIEAARQLAKFIHKDISKKQKKKLINAIKEYEKTLLFTSERPESQTALALLYLDLRKLDKVSTAFKEALKLQNKYIPAYINYADYLRAIKQEEKSFIVLQKGLQIVPDSGVLHQALGLWYIRNFQQNKGLKSLDKAHQLAPNNTYIQYTYAIALASTNITKTIEILEAELKKHTGSMLLINALTSCYEQVKEKRKKTNLISN